MKRRRRRSAGGPPVHPLPASLSAHKKAKARRSHLHPALDPESQLSTLDLRPSTFDSRCRLSTFDLRLSLSTLDLRLSAVGCRLSTLRHCQPATLRSDRVNA